jgi:broad specificity phosphatase PhoE
MTYTLILLRHGQSEWNEKNLFTGWVDVALTEKGREEATRGGHLLTEAGILPDIVYTSRQKRAIITANLALEAADRSWIDVKRNWRLNERHYGALQGKDKAQTLATPRRRPSTTPASTRRPTTRATRTSATTSRAPSASRTSSTASCRTGSPTSPRTSGPAGPC